MIANNVPCDRNTKELIRIIDSDAMARKICNNKFKQNSQLVNLQARKQFHGATRSAVKCMIGFNHYGERHKKINMNLLSNKCPRCDRAETWCHVVQCKALREKNNLFINTVARELKKVSNTEIQHNVINDIKLDMEEFLINSKETHITNQKKLGWDQAFRGYVVKT